MGMDRRFTFIGSSGSLSFFFFSFFFLEYIVYLTPGGFLVSLGTGTAMTQATRARSTTDRLTVVRIVTMGDIPYQGAVALFDLFLIQRKGERKSFDI